MTEEASPPITSMPEDAFNAYKPSSEASLDVKTQWAFLLVTRALTQVNRSVVEVAKHLPSEAKDDAFKLILKSADRLDELINGLDIFTRS